MWPFRYQSLFRSRWLALAWAIGICFTAVQVAGWGDKGDGGGGNAAAASSSEADLAKLQARIADFESKQ